eukprot:6655646-Pyramimonas_sp.AAC.1
MRALACNAIWTASSAKLAGYQISDICQRCHSEVDTLWHRLWECPSCSSVREEIAEDDLIASALNTAAEGYEATLWIYGAFRHP